MNATVRTILIFVLLVGAVVLASFVYRRAAPAGGARTDVAAQPLDEAALDPELKLAFEALNEGREEEAARHLRAVPPGSPSHPAALRQLAVLAARNGDFDEAVASLLALIAQRPDDPEVHASLGWVFFLADRYEEAEFAALRALELDPDHVSTRYNIGLYRIAQGSTQLGISSYIRAMRADPNGRQIARHEDRLRGFHDAHPDRPGPHYALAFFADSTHDPATEIEELEHYLPLAPPGAEKDAATSKLEQVRAERDR